MKVRRDKNEVKTYLMVVLTVWGGAIVGFVVGVEGGGDFGGGGDGGGGGGTTFGSGGGGDGGGVAVEGLFALVPLGGGGDGARVTASHRTTSKAVKTHAMKGTLYMMEAC